MKKILLTTVLSLGLVFPALAQMGPPTSGCSDEGGVLKDCIARANRMRKGHPVPPGEYHSGGTYTIKSAGCISPEAIFRFHGAWRPGPGYPIMDSHGNRQQRQMFAHSGNLLPYLDSVRAWDSVEYTTLTGEQVAQLTGKPLCR